MFNNASHTPILKLEALDEGKLEHVKIDGIELMLARIDDQVSVLHAKCPHEGSDLSVGDFDGETIKCPMHGWTFNIRTGERLDRPGTCLTQFDSNVIDNEIVIDQQQLANFLAKKSTQSKYCPTGNKTKSVTDLPGPKGLPLLGNMFQIKMPQLPSILRQWSQTFGDIYHIRLPQGPVLVISDSTLIRGLLRERPDTFRRIRTFEGFFKEINGHGVFSQEGEGWERHRRIIVPALNLTHIKDFYPTLNMYTGRLLNKWLASSHKQEDVDLCKVFSDFTGDVAINATLGRDLNMLEGKVDPLREAMIVIFERIVARSLAPFPYWRYIKLPKDRALDRALVVVNKAVTELMQDARDRMAGKEDNEAQTFLDALVSWKDEEGQRLIDEDIHGNAMTMIAAGGDTTAHSLSWVVYYMCTQAGVQQKMQEEADKVLSDSDFLSTKDDFRRVPYINSVIKEAMRLKPVGPFGPHEPNIDVEIEGISVPKGTMMFLMTDTACVDNKNFNNAQSFIPERWMDSPQASPDPQPQASLPFGYGPRLCPGRMLALQQITSVATMLAKNFTISLKDNHPEVKEVFEFTMHPSKIYVNFSDRNEARNNSGRAKFAGADVC